MSDKYRLSLVNGAGEEVSFRSFKLGFDGVGHNGYHSHDEEYFFERKAVEMYWDAAHRVGRLSWLREQKKAEGGAA
jgi:hypothetical protein